MEPLESGRDRCNGGRVRRIAQEGLRSLGWFYLSFATKYQFRGAAIVWAHGVLTAIKRASDLGINPGGEVLCYAIPRKHLRSVPTDMRHRLLSEAEVRKRLAGRRLVE
jgi:hypothetical protein